MNFKIKYAVLVLVFLLLQNVVNAQSTYEIGALPSFNLNNKLKNNWSLNYKLESRQLFQRGEINGVSEKKYAYLLTDVSVVAAKKIGLNSKIAAGYLLRFEQDDIYHRLMQQYILVQKMAGFRLAHRFLIDQTFSEAEKMELRLRYRISTEIPLNGKSVDAGEFYIKLNNEYVNSFQASEYDLEIRVVPLIGYDIKENFKIETGMDYRVDSFINSISDQSYWLVLNFFVNI